MEKLTPEQRQEKHLNKLTTDLNLNAKQQEEVKKLLAEQSAKAAEFKAKREAKKDKQLLASAKERKEMAQKMKAEKEANDAKMKSILTPGQYTKWENDREIRKEKMAHVKNMGRSLKFEKKNKWIFQYFLPFYLKDYYLILTSLNSKNWVICKQKKIVFISI
jgi:predicted  nucleic acid-binding Zn-ribbon protein